MLTARSNRREITPTHPRPYRPKVRRPSVFQTVEVGVFDVPEAAVPVCRVGGPIGHGVLPLFALRNRLVGNANRLRLRNRRQVAPAEGRLDGQLTGATWLAGVAPW